MEVASGGDGGGVVNGGRKSKWSAAKAGLSESVAEVARDGAERGASRLLELREPGKAARALEMMAEGAELGVIKRETGIGFEGLVALRVRHERPLAERRKELAMDAFETQERFRLVTNRKLKRLAEDDKLLDKTSVKDLALGYGIFGDKAFQALGEASRVIVEHRKGPSIEDVKAEIEAARAKLKAGAVEVVVTPAEPAEGGHAD